MLGMKQPTYVQLKNKKGSFGLHLLLQVRAGIRMSIDDLLDLEPKLPAAATVETKAKDDEPSPQLVAAVAAALAALPTVQGREKVIPIKPASKRKSE